jgi:hypothetical protein
VRENTHRKAMDNLRPCPVASQPERGWRLPQSGYTPATAGLDISSVKYP